MYTVRIKKFHFRNVCERGCTFSYWSAGLATEWKTCQISSISLLREILLTNWLLRNPEIHHYSYISLPLVPILSNIFSVFSITTHLPQIHFNIILPSVSQVPQVFLNYAFLACSIQSMSLSHLHPLLAVCNFLFNIFATTLHIWRPSPLSTI